MPSEPTFMDKALESMKTLMGGKPDVGPLARALEKMDKAKQQGEVPVFNEDELDAYNEHMRERAQGTIDVAVSTPISEKRIEPDNVDATLAQRGGRYGLFVDNSKVYVQFMSMVEQSPNYQRLSPAARHALGNIGTKLARLLTGDPDYHDNWLDIAGYATLMAKICQGEKR